MILDATPNLTPGWNNSDWVFLVALLVFLGLGLLLGAKKIAARIVGEAVAILGSLALANLVLPYLYPMEWYQKAISILFGSATAVNWIFYLLLSGAFYGAIFLLWKLVFNHLINGVKDAPVVSRILGMILGFADWAILLLAVAFLFAALPSWLGSAAPGWVTYGHDYLGSSQFAGGLVDLCAKLVNLLGATGHP
jgi:hypothetical protein